MELLVPSLSHGFREQNSIHKYNRQCYSDGRGEQRSGFARHGNYLLPIGKLNHFSSAQPTLLDADGFRRLSRGYGLGQRSQNYLLRVDHLISSVRYDL
jgi:hypothetical protein